MTGCRPSDSAAGTAGVDAGQAASPRRSASSLARCCPLPARRARRALCRCRRSPFPRSRRSSRRPLPGLRFRPAPVRSRSIPGGASSRSSSIAPARLQGSAHNHVVTSGQESGFAWEGGDPAGSGFEIRVPVASLVVDDPAARAAAGGEFAGEVPESAREGTYRNMTRPEVLDVAEFPGSHRALQGPRRDLGAARRRCRPDDSRGDATRRNPHRARAWPRHAGRRAAPSASGRLTSASRRSASRAVRSRWATNSSCASRSWPWRIEAAAPGSGRARGPAGRGSRLVRDRREQQPGALGCLEQRVLPRRPGRAAVGSGMR